MNRRSCFTADFGHVLMQMKVQMVSAKSPDTLKAALEATKDATEPKGPCPHATAYSCIKQLLCCVSRGQPPASLVAYLLHQATM